MNKTKILLESIGENVRLTLASTEDETSNIMFQNLKWLCTKQVDVLENDSKVFIAPKNKLMLAIQAYRASNISQPRRGKQLWKESPFLFQVVSQKTFDTKGFEDYRQGEHQDGETNPWQDYKPSLSKYFNN